MDQFYLQINNNELSEAERSHFEERLATDDALAKAFAEYSKNDQVYRHAFSAIDETPIPDSILSLLEAPEQEVPLSNENVIELKSWQRAKWLPIAASFLIIALALPVFLMTNEQDSLTVASVLDSELSGQTIELDASTNLELVMSFSDKQGRFCREYLFSQPTGTEQRIACKVDDVWQTQVSDSLNVVDGNNYQAASSGSSNKIETWLDINMSGIPFSTSTEEETLNRSVLQE